MRSCIYCGRELAPGEKCTCRQSSQHRSTTDNTDSAASEQSNAGQNTGNAYSTYNDPNRTEYRTGYTHKDNSFKKAYEKAKAKAKRSRKSRADMNYEARSFWRQIWVALKYPVDTVQNPKLMKLPAMLVLWAIQGALAWLCLFFVVTHAARGPFALLGNLLAFNGITGYRVIGYMLLSMLSGAVAGIIGFFVYTGVFYLINRFIFHDRHTRYEEFCQRLAFTAVPFSAVALVGTLASMLSVTTLAILLVCGAATFVILTYEALKTQWSMQDANKAVYGVMLGLFVIAVIVGYIVRLS